jgi:Skp family chaperone for outer membrane proteins
LSLQFAVVAGLFGAVWFLTALAGHGTAAARGSSSIAPARIALVDMGYIFQNYKKLADLRVELKEAADAAEAKAKDIVSQARTIDEQMKSGEFEDGSQEFLDSEKKLIQLSSRFETFKALATRNLKKKDAEALVTCYQDVQKALAVFAEQNGYTLMLQVNRDLMATEDTNRVTRKLGQTVFHVHAGEDITEAVLAYLTQQYGSNVVEKKEARPAAEPTAPTKTVRKPATAAKATPPRR